MKTRLLYSLSNILTFLAVLAICACARPAHAQDTNPAPAHDNNKILHTIATYLIGVGGYWFTDSTAFRALGSPKFGGTTRFFVRPARRGVMEITGGLEIASASDHWLPFSGGNSFSLIGPAFRIRTTPHLNRLSPYFEAGVFYGELNSKRENFNAYNIVPSAAVGVEFRFARYLSLTASYRVSGAVGDVIT